MDEKTKKMLYKRTCIAICAGLIGAGRQYHIYVVRQANWRFVHIWWKRWFQKRGVAIAYDFRHQSLPWVCFAVLWKHGIKIYVWKLPSDTRIIIFRARHFKAFAGIMITAVTTYPFNGYKVYGEDGGQMSASWCWCSEH